MKQLLYCLFFLSLAFTARAQSVTPPYTLLGDQYTETKNYYLLTLLSRQPEARKLLEADAALGQLTRQKKDQLTRTLRECAADARCYTEPMKFTAEEIKTVGDRLRELYKDNNALGRLVSAHLRPSGMYGLYRSLGPADLLVKAWEQDASGVNFVIGVYAQGQKPGYPAIDSVSFNVRTPRFAQLVNTATQTVWDETRKATLFFEPSLTYALRFLEINGRDEAADFEPLTAGENRAAYERIQKTDWKKYPYTLILVLGAGPSEHDVALSPEGMLRCRVAALRYREGLAPFVVVSGGRVHPFRTKYSEAYEMKKYLMTALQIPEHAILIEPHARHTTTNLRNCARLIFRYGMPADKPSLVSSARMHSQYVTNGACEQRCQKELHYVPYRNGKRLTETDSEFYPLIEALQSNPMEPLDP